MAKQKTILEKISVQGADANSRASEEYLIKSLFSGNLADEILTLKEEAFFSLDLREVFKTIKRLKEEGKDSDPISVISAMTNDLDTRNVFESIGYQKSPEDWAGTLDAINDLIRRTVLNNFALDDSGSRIYEHLARVKDLYKKRLSDKAAIFLENSDKIPADDLISALAQVQADLTAATSGGHYSLFRNISEEDIFEEMREDYEGLATGYRVYDEPKNEYKHEHEIKIPRGAITLVCGKQGHGKSTFLRNLALRIARKENEEGEVIYLSYEESVKKIVPKFISLNFGKKIETKEFKEGGNIDRIRGYFRGEKGHITNLEDFEKSLKDFNGLRTTGRFKIISPLHSSRDIVSALRAYIAQPGVKVAAVFVDYIQFMKSGRNMKEKRLDINEILNDFLNFAKETDIPVIAAAQLAKEAASPETMSDDNIAESADLGRYADLVLCLWNSRKKSHVKKDSNYISDDPESHYQKHLVKRGFVLGESGHIYVKVCKSRDIDSGADNVFTFNGNTGVVGDIPQGINDIPKEYCSHDYLEENRVI